MRVHCLFLLLLPCFLVSCGGDTVTNLPEDSSLAIDSSESISPPIAMVKEEEPTMVAIEEFDSAEIVIETPPVVKKKKVKEKSKKRDKRRSKKKAKSKKRPKIEFTSDLYDFGKIMEGEIVEHEFKFKNTGDAPLTINNTTVTCGCTTPSYPFIPIEPGGEGVIGITFNSTGKLGTQKPSVTLITNARPSTYKLYLKGLVDTPRKTDQKVGEKKDTIQ